MGSYGRLIDGQEVIEKVHNDNSPWRNVMKFKMNDCPKCGAKQDDRLLSYSYFGFKINHDGWAAYCRECKTTTIMCETLEEAVRRWNEGDMT